MTLLRSAANSYRHFNVAIYARVYKVRQMADLDRLKARFDTSIRPHSFRVFRLVV